MSNQSVSGELAAAGFSLVLFAAYHVWLRRQVRVDPAYTIQGMLNRGRTAWVERMMAKQEGILAVQTLRNSIMAATFFASTAVALIVGTITLSTRSVALSRATEFMGGPGTDPLWMPKIFVLLVDMLCAFVFFCQTIRLFSHVGLMISVPLEVAKTELVADILIKAGRYQTRGMRCYYYAGPMLFWLFGPWFLVAASGGLLIALYYLDRSPADSFPSSA